MGFIYCITFPSGKKYIGQTRQKIEKRLMQHSVCKNDTLISRAFNKYKEYTYEILIESINEELDEYEKIFIEKYKTITPNGYNMRSGGQNGYYFSEEIKYKCSLKARIYNKDLPMYIYETENGFRCRPPNKPERYFNYKFLDKNIKLNLAKEYLEDKNELYKKYIEPQSLPKFICKVKRNNREGYRVTMPNYEKHFTSMKLTMEEKYKLTIDYLNSIMEKVQRLNDCGE
jgi:hypothetical protein